METHTDCAKDARWKPTQNAAIPASEPMRISRRCKDWLAAHIDDSMANMKEQGTRKTILSNVVALTGNPHAILARAVFSKSCICVLCQYPPSYHTLPTCIWSIFHMRHVIHGYPWKSIDIHGYPWILTDIVGSRWIRIDIDG